MKLIPERPLWTLLVIPVVLALLVPTSADAIILVSLADAGILGLLLLDYRLSHTQALQIERQAPNNLPLERAAPIRLALKNLSARALQVQVHQDLPTHFESAALPIGLRLVPHEQKTISYPLVAKRRGLHTIGETHYRVRSFLGFISIQHTLPMQDSVKVYPDLAPVRNMDLVAKLGLKDNPSRPTRRRGGDTEFDRLRDYQHDDSFRRIDWRATARRQTLTVRDYQLERNQNIVILLDSGRMMTPEWDGLPAFDHALRAGLFLCHVAVRRGDRAGLISFDAQVNAVIKPSGGQAVARRMLARTFNVFPRMVESDYDAAFRALQRHVKRRSMVVLLTHLFDEGSAARIERLCRSLLPHHLPVCALLQDEDLHDEFSKPAFSERDYCIKGAAAEVLLSRHRAVKRMRKSGILVVHAPARDLATGVISQYLEAKASGLL